MICCSRLPRSLPLGELSCRGRLSSSRFPLFIRGGVPDPQKSFREAGLVLRHPGSLARVKMLFPSSLFIFEVIILTNQGQADFHTMWTNISIHTTGSGCMISCFYWFFLIISLSWKLCSSVASLYTEWFWITYSSPALCGSSWPFLSFRVLISCLGLGTCHGVWGDNSFISRYMGEELEQKLGEGQGDREECSVHPFHDTTT